MDSSPRAAGGKVQMQAMRQCGGGSSGKFSSDYFHFFQRSRKQGGEPRVRLREEEVLQV